MLSDIEIARSVKLRPINEVAEELGLNAMSSPPIGTYLNIIVSKSAGIRKNMYNIQFFFTYVTLLFNDCFFSFICCDLHSFSHFVFFT